MGRCLLSGDEIAEMDVFATNSRLGVWSNTFDGEGYYGAEFSNV